MKILRLTLPVLALGLLVLASTASAQDADKAKLIEIEKSIRCEPNSQSPIGGGRKTISLRWPSESAHADGPNRHAAQSPGH